MFFDIKKSTTKMNISFEAIAEALFQINNRLAKMENQLCFPYSNSKRRNAGIDPPSQNDEFEGDELNDVDPLTDLISATIEIEMKASDYRIAAIHCLKELRAKAEETIRAGSDNASVVNRNDVDDKDSCQKRTHDKIDDNNTLEYKEWKKKYNSFIDTLDGLIETNHSSDESGCHAKKDKRV
jgi:hypothetical protein